jgi:hypothetical protein
LREHLVLERRELGDPLLGQVEHPVELLPIEGPRLAGSLNLDESPATRLDDVEVDLGPPRTPIDTAAIESRIGVRLRYSRSTRRLQARARATYAPVIAAVRVPPSACSTSQSTYRHRSPRASMSVTARSERPIRRWISCVRPESFPREASRSLRVSVEPGSSEYSAVTQPRPEPRRKPGTCSAT